MSTRVKITADDPFGLSGKNPERVAPAVRQNIAIQKGRVRAAWIMAIICLLIASAPLFGFSALFCLAAIFLPYYFFAAFFDRHALKFEQSRLAECERLIQKGQTPA